MNETKRFIAGAVCPSCQSVDKIMLDKSGHIQRIECVKCGFAKTQDFSTQ